MAVTVNATLPMRTSHVVVVRAGSGRAALALFHGPPSAARPKPARAPATRAVAPCALLDQLDRRVAAEAGAVQLLVPELAREVWERGSC